MKEYDGRVRLIFKDRPLSIHTHARGAHEAARCAGAMGKYWAYHDKLFERQPAFRRDDLVNYAAELGLDRAEFARCVDQRRFAADVERDVGQAQALGVSSTPAFLVNGRPIVGARGVEEFRAIVEEALKARR